MEKTTAKTKKTKTEKMEIEQKPSQNTEDKTAEVSEKQEQKTEGQASEIITPIEKTAEEQAAEIIEPVEKTEEDLIEKALRKAEEQRLNRLASWNPKTRLGREIKEGKIKDIDEILKSKQKILEAEIVDKLLILGSDLLSIGQSKGKFGGGKRRAWRQTQRKTAEGNQPSFACMAVTGDREGHVGIGYGKSKETLPAREKAERNAKLNIAKIARGCGSFDCSCNEEHSIPFKVEGKCGSSRMILMPAPRGTGLVIENECKKILGFAGIKDVYSKTFGQTRTKINLVKACFNALKKLEKIKR